MWTCIIATVAIITVFCLLPIKIVSAAPADDAMTIADYINDNKTTFGLDAVAVDDTVTITGTAVKTGVPTIELNIGMGVTVIWSANYTASHADSFNYKPLVHVKSGAGNFQIDNGSIITSGSVDTATALLVSDHLGSEYSGTIILNNAILNAEGYGKGLDLEGYATGSIVIDGLSTKISSKSDIALRNYSKATLEINGGEIAATGTSNTALMNYGKKMTTISGGIISANRIAVYNGDSAGMDISGGTIKSFGTHSNSMAIYQLLSKKITISGNASISSGNSRTVHVEITAPATNVVVIEINGGTIENTGTGAAISLGRADNILITDGTITGGVDNAADGCIDISGGEITGTVSSKAAGKVNISGGKFFNEDNYTLINSGTGSIEISEGLITNGFAGGPTVLNTGEGEVAISGGTISHTNGNSAIYNQGNGYVHISEANAATPTLITSAADDTNLANMMATIVLAANTSNTSTLTIDGGVVENTATTTNSMALRNNGAGEMQIDGGKITTASEDGGYGIYNAQSGVVTMSDGAITSKSAGIVNVGDGKINISGGALDAETYAIINHTIDGTITLSKEPRVNNTIKSANAIYTIAPLILNESVNLEIATAASIPMDVVIPHEYIEDFTHTDIAGFTIGIRKHGDNLEVYPLAYSLNDKAWSLGEIELPEGWEWVSPSEGIAEGANNKLKVNGEIFDVAIACKHSALAPGIETIEPPTLEREGTIFGKCEMCGKDILIRNIDKLIDIGLADATVIPDQKYTGQKIEPLITLTHNGQTLILGEDYTVEYVSNTQQGTATIIITAKGYPSLYGGSKTITFLIKTDLEKGEGTNPNTGVTDNAAVYFLAIALSFIVLLGLWKKKNKSNVG